MNVSSTFERNALNHYHSALDLPYARISQGTAEAIFDHEGRQLADDWTGIIVSAVSTREFWRVEAKAGRRVTTRLGRFDNLREAQRFIA